MKFEFPKDGRITALNQGEAYGSLYFTHGIDLSTEPGRVISSPNALKVLTQDDSSTFDNPMGSLLTYNGRWFGMCDAIFRGTSGQAEQPTVGWALDNTASTPTIDWDEGDAAVFDGLYLVAGVSGSGDIYAYNGTAWSSWWEGTLGQSGLSSTGRKCLVVGSTGRLYILDAQNKIYNVTAAGNVDLSGGGTLDFSATPYKFICMRATSTRLWLGGFDESTSESVVVEWDMSLNEATANRIYKLPAHGVISILIWEDLPVLMLSNGTLRFFDGTAFVEREGARLPEPPSGYSYDGDYPGNALIAVSDFIMHPNGSAIIDGLPHFLISARLVKNIGGSFDTTSGRTINPAIYAGIYCYDPNIGFYNRFPIERSGGTSGFGACIQTPGALVAAHSPDTKFLASCTVVQNGSTKAVLLADDSARTLAARGRYALNPFWGEGKDVWTLAETLATPLRSSSDRILLKYRLAKSGSLPINVAVTWSSTTVFTSTDAGFANVVEGDWVLVTIGNGAGCTAHVSSIEESGGTYTVTLDEAITGVSDTNTGRVIVDNWRRLATISAQYTDYHDKAISNTKQSHTFWLMAELRSAAGSTVEIDKHIVTSKPS